MLLTWEKFSRWCDQWWIWVYLKSQTDIGSRSCAAFLGFPAKGPISGCPAVMFVVRPQLSEWAKIQNWAKEALLMAQTITPCPDTRGFLKGPSIWYVRKVVSKPGSNPLNGERFPCLESTGSRLPLAGVGNSKRRLLQSRVAVEPRAARFL